MCGNLLKIESYVHFVQQGTTGWPGIQPVASKYRWD